MACLGQSRDAQTPSQGISAGAWGGHRPCCARQGRPGPHTILHTHSSEEWRISLFQSVKQIQKVKQSSLSNQLLSDASPTAPPTLPSLGSMKPYNHTTLISPRMEGVVMATEHFLKHRNGVHYCSVSLAVAKRSVWQLFSI